MATAPFKIDYFISRRGTHAALAQEVAAVLNDVGLSSFTQDHDIPFGANFIGKIHDALGRCEHFIALLNADYADSPYTRAEWTNFYPTYVESGGERRFIVIRLEDCQPPGLMRGIVYADLVGITDSQERRKRIIAATKGQSAAAPLANWLFENVPNRDLNFTGRDERLTELHKLLSGGDTPAAITQATQAAIHGLGGIGKTTLAAEYAHRYAGAYSGVWWAPAENHAGLIANLAALAGRLDPQLGHEPDQEKAARTGLSLIARRTGLPFLLIYDNADSRETVHNLLPPGGARLLITTRYPDWSGLAQELKLDVLMPAAAKELLQKRAGREGADSEGAARLAEALGCLPLALDHAGAYCKTRGTSFDDYGKRLEARIAFVPKGAPYPDSVAATFELAIEKAASDNKDAETLLGFFSFLAPDLIPLDLIDESILGEDDRAEALGALAGVSLVEYVIMDAHAPLISVHRLVQAAMRRRLANREKVADTIGRVTRRLNAIFPIDGYSDPRSWPRCAALLPHVLTLRHHAQWDQASRRDAAELLTGAGQYTHGRAAYVEAEPLLRQALAVGEAARGRNSSASANYRNNLAVLLGDIGLNLEAENLIREAIAIHEEIHEHENEYVATSLNSLAGVLTATGRIAEAEKQIREALTITEKIFGRNHPKTAIQINNLAAILIDTGGYVEAEMLLREALLISETTTGTEHPSFANRLGNLAIVLLKTDRAADALPFAERAVAISENLRGIAHPGTVTCAWNYVQTLTALGRNDEAAAVRTRFGLTE
jgi:tetratricopeptide (TPR) repeat protein